MIKKIVSCLILACFLFVGVASSHAQLVDWSRRKRDLRKAGNSPKAEKIAKEMPRWVRVMPKARTKEERRYDVNRDGRLQLAEAKIFLRDVLDQIKAKGGITIKSNILKEYDKNRDGVISRSEAKILEEHVR